MHVRNTDNQKSERFRIDISRHLTVVQRLYRRMQNAGVFLATDSHATERLYRARIPNLCVVPKTYPSDEQQSLHHCQTLLDKKQSTFNTIIELLLLGRASTIIHSSKSTFAQTALRFANNPDVTVIDVESAASRICVLLAINETKLRKRFTILFRGISKAKRSKMRFTKAFRTFRK